MTSLVETGRTIIANGCACDRLCERLADGHCGCRDDARAFLRAMREPSEAMRQAGITDILRGGLGWQAMVDVALKEGGR